MTNTTFTRSAIELAEKLDVELWPDCPVTPFLQFIVQDHGIIEPASFPFTRS